MDENEETFEERLNKLDFSKNHLDNDFLAKIYGVCSILYPQFNKEEYSNLTIDQRRIGYHNLVWDKVKKHMNSKDITRQTKFINEIIEEYIKRIIVLHSTKINNET